MKTVLCYGDSNTWGYISGGLGRYSYDKRWTGVLSTLLGEDYIIIEEGLNGRTTVFDDPFDDYLNGRRYLPIALKSHAPVDIVIIMLGTNDLKHRFRANGYDIALGLFTLGEMALSGFSYHQSHVPEVVLVSPSYIICPDSLEVDEWAGANEKIKAMENHLEKMVQDTPLRYVKASDFVNLTSGDGIHLMDKDHENLANGIYDYILKENI